MGEPGQLPDRTIRFLFLVLTFNGILSISADAGTDRAGLVRTTFRPWRYRGGSRATDPLKENNLAAISVSFNRGDIGRYLFL